MSFPKVLQQVWLMDSGDLCSVGQYLGYDWNSVCNEISKTQYYAMDGNGSFSVYRLPEEDENEYAEYSESKVINHIVASIFEAYPDVKEITITN